MQVAFWQQNKVVGKLFHLDWQEKNRLTSKTKPKQPTHFTMHASPQNVLQIKMLAILLLIQETTLPQITEYTLILIHPKLNTTWHALRVFV